MNSREDKTSKQAARRPKVESAKLADQIARTLEDVAHCPDCECDMVYPIDWEQADGNHWRVTLRCPNCEDVTQGVMGEDLIEKFDCALDRGTDSLVRDLRNLTYANMATEINSFVSALDGDYLLPEDF
ncbi:MAG: hypothetical protein WAP35_10720 [Solirubrobacterales bacterium]